MKKNVSPVAGAIAIVIIVLVAAIAGYQTFLKPVPNEPINPNPGMQKMMADMKAYGAQVRAKQTSRTNPNPDNPLGR